MDINFDVIYLDSDGVLVDFEGYFREKIGKSHADFERKSEFWEEVKRLNKIEPVFESMNFLPHAWLLISLCQTMFKEVKILTASGGVPKDAPAQKINFYKKHYPNIECIVVENSVDKSRYAAPGVILVDDMPKSINPWIEKGGIGILHKSVAETAVELNRICSFDTMQVLLNKAQELGVVYEP